MARIRTIKPEFWRSPSTAKASPWARLLYIAMWNWADDHGRAEWTPMELLAFAFPHDAENPHFVAEFPRLVSEVSECFSVEFYEHRGRRFYAITTWDAHQRNEKRTASRVPDPDDPECTPDKAIYPSSGNSAESVGNSATSGGDTVPGTRGTRGTRGTEGTRGTRAHPLTSFGGAGGGLAPDQPAEPVDNSTSTVVDVPTKTKRGTRLPDNWAPNLDLPANQRLHAQHTSEWLSDQLERFRDYWGAKTGKDATKADWDATWRNWIKRSADQEKPRQTPEAARIQAMYADASTRDVSIFQQIIDADDARRRQAS